MATRILLRRLISKTPSPRIFSTTSTTTIPRIRPLITVVACPLRQSTNTRAFCTLSDDDQNSNWTTCSEDDQESEGSVLLEGCDFEHWRVVVEKPEGEPTRDEIIDSYINILAKVVGSYDDARMKIYSVSTRYYYCFGALVSEGDSYKLKELPGVRWVPPDAYSDVENKQYDGEPFIDGKAVPYDPKYHEEWVRENCARQQAMRNRRNDDE